MTPELLVIHAQKRREGFVHILDAPQLFKVCTQCRSISPAHSPTCFVCRAYRFSTSPIYVEATALIARENVFPLTVGTVPRISTMCGPEPPR